jgi:hypothetical protein
MGDPSALSTTNETRRDYVQSGTKCSDSGIEFTLYEE